MLASQFYFILKNKLIYYFKFITCHANFNSNNANLVISFIRKWWSWMEQCHLVPRGHFKLLLIINIIVIINLGHNGPFIAREFCTVSEGNSSPEGAARGTGIPRGHSTKLKGNKVHCPWLIYCFLHQTGL